MSGLMKIDFEQRKYWINGTSIEYTAKKPAKISSTLGFAVIFGS